MSHLFSSLKLRSLTARNRIVVSPMCQYSCQDGLATPWHLVHLGSRAVGGAAIIFVEATGVSAEGRISPGDMGIWSDRHTEALAPIAKFIREQGAIPGIQLAHAGRKASTARPWEGGGKVSIEEGGWQPVGASALPFSSGSWVPRALETNELARITTEFVEAAKRARDAGFQVIEVHAAHGYLLHSFLSPLSNQRTDNYGGSLENRERLVLDVVKGIRGVWSDDLPLFVRLSCTDWVRGGWDVDESVHLGKALRELGVDAIDCSSGGLSPDQRISLGPGYQLPFAERLKREVPIATVGVGMITEAHQADDAIGQGRCDLVAMARELLRDPYWPLHAARVLGDEVRWPDQYLRAKPS
jgi:2,4-dienoyl-CoA reductase-like NADH-dependent reductase (Old Yellow Enzyme family)